MVEERIGGVLMETDVLRKVQAKLEQECRFVETMEHFGRPVVGDRYYPPPPVRTVVGH
jgi:hypothetical protein